jgi:hypothetical protein
MQISQKLFEVGIGFRRGEDFYPLPVDDQNPSFPASKYSLCKATLGRISSAWKQWKGFVAKVLSSAEGRSFASQFFPKGTEAFVSKFAATGTEGWNDRQRAEFDSFRPGQNYFLGPHVTRIDFGLNQRNELVIIDPNVMPYGIAPMVAAHEILGLKSQEAYLDQLGAFNPTWVVDRYHGNAFSTKWLTDRAGAQFAFSDEFRAADTVVRLSRMDVSGKTATVGAAGIRIFESQVWNALMNISGVAEFFGFALDLPLHRANCASCFLLKLSGGMMEIAQGFNKGEIQWMKFDDFASSQWALGSEKVFLKCLATSGCRQVNVSEFKRPRIFDAINTKLGHSGYFLLQPALPCLVDGERVRVASYLGPNKEHYGSEVTRVPSENSFAHGGSHAKLSYLVL